MNQALHEARTTVGAVVQLMSGGPLMTVVGVVPAKGEAVALCRCHYFFEGIHREAFVPAAGLKVIL